MGDIAEMMLDGTLCEGCGEYLGEGDGYPQYCAGCAEPQPRAAPSKRRSRIHQCPECKKMCRGKAGLAHHRREVHGVPL